MTKKQFYTAPSVEVFDFATEVMLIGSKKTDVDVYEEETEDDAVMSNKKNPWQHTWE